MFADNLIKYKKEILACLVISLIAFWCTKITLFPIYEGGSVFYHLFYSLNLHQVNDLLQYMAMVALSLIAILNFRRIDRKYMIFSIILSVFFSVMMSFGRAFKNSDSASPIFINHVQIFKFTLSTLGYFVLFFSIIFIIFLSLEHHKTRSFCFDREDAFSIFIKSKPLLFFIIILLITIFIYMFFMPGFIMGDTASQIIESFGLKAIYFPTGFPYVYNDSTLTNMHPVASTLYYYVCLRLGNAIFGSYNAGMFIAAVIQFSIYDLVIARACYVLAKLNIKGRYILAYLIYLFINVLIVSYMFLFSKDIIYTACLFLFLIELLLIMTKREKKTDYILICAAAIGTAAFRGEGLYIILIVLFITMIMLIIQKRELPKIIFGGSLILGLIVIHLAWTGLVFPALHVSPGVKGIQLTIPIQQVGRYVSSGAELTEEEYASINNVMDINRIKEEYVPSDGDALSRNLFRHECSKEEMDAFLKTWLKICVKSPKNALGAWLNTKYEYFYLENVYMNLYSFSWSQAMMSSLNTYVYEPTGIELGLSYPDSSLFVHLRDFAEKMTSLIRVIPVLNILMMPGFYVLMLFIVSIYMFMNKSRHGILMLTALWCVFVITDLFSAVNASYGRYLYPIILILPFILLAGSNDEKALTL